MPYMVFQGHYISYFDSKLPTQGLVRLKSSLLKFYGCHHSTSWNSIQYSQRHNVIIHCDRHITLLADMNIYLLFCLY